jgi:hypothetical protein
MAAALGFIGPAISAIGALGGMFGGTPSQNVATPNYQSMQLPNMQEAAQSYLGGTTQAQSYFDPLFKGVTGPAQTAAMGLYNNPYAALFQQGAGGASNMAMNAALAQSGLGYGLAGQGMGMAGPAGQVLATGFDPQQALYARTAQQLQDQMRASSAARGVAMSPFGAGLENQAMSNFNIDWQNAQLQRQLQALAGYGGALGQGAQLTGQGAQMFGAAPGQYLAGASMPYGTFQNIGGQQLGNLQTLLGLYGGAQQGVLAPLQNYAQYVQMGNQANQAANQAAMNQLAQSQMAFGQQQTLGKQLGGALAGFGKAFGGQPGNPYAYGGYGGTTGWGF